ncbi:PHP domain-containing protein [Phytoactinopolyspora endophytica]|uniref:PHP domain-containing protein n=1 Tax=Phytoactinopolyspora endophytica TaxID=1642495 RepID=UPI00101D4B97|nr:PHP domain-containing protein [Phytoactinopolyspora endophytica]
MVLPADSHVHSGWSWDSPGGSMERTCTRVVELGPPAVAFTDHMDFTALESCRRRSRGLRASPGIHDAGRIARSPAMDVNGCLECVQRCRDQFPQLRIITGVELGEAHRNSESAAKLLDAGRFELAIGGAHGFHPSRHPYDVWIRPN